MAKDPATLWYWNDWHGGTSTFSRHLKGCYTDLLHAQFNNGHLSLDEIKTVLGSDFGSSWPTLRKKFAVDNDGLFFNERAELEKNKRIAFVESRKNNLKSHKEEHMNTHKDSLMENENRNAIAIEVKNEKWPFENFWDAYSKKQDKAKCEKKWALIDDLDKESIMCHVPRYVASTPDIQFRKHPATYLNNRSWENEIIIQTNGNNGTSKIIANKQQSDEAIARLTAQEH